MFIATDAGLTAVDVYDESAGYLTYSPVNITNGVNELDVTPDGRFVYAVSGQNQTLYRFNADVDPVTNPFGLLSELPLYAEPRGILVDRGGRRVFIPTSAGDIQVWDVRKNSDTFDKQIGNIVSPDPNLTGALATDPAGDYLLALSGAGKVLIFNLGPDTLLTTVGVRSDPRDIVIDPVGQRAYVTDGDGYVTVVSLPSFQKDQDIPTGGSLEGCAITAAGSFLYVANFQLDDFDVIDLRENSPTYHMIATRIPQRVNPVNIAFSPDGQYSFSIVESEQQLIISAMGAGSVLSSLSRHAAPEGAQLNNCSPPSYSCIQDWAECGTGIISTEPCLTDPASGDSTGCRASFHQARHRWSGSGCSPRDP